MEQTEAQKVFEKLRVLYNFKTLTELSKYFEKTGNWAAQMGKNDSIPYSICIQACKEKGVSLDWLLLDKEKSQAVTPVTKKEFINNVKECFYECWELDLLPDYPKESISAISILFMNNFGEMINISRDKESFKDKKRSI